MIAFAAINSIELDILLSRVMFKIRLDGMLLARYPNALGLKIGQMFNLSNGSFLKVQLLPAGTNYKLQVMLNNQVLNAADPEGDEKLSGAYNAVFTIGVLNLLIGFIAVLFKIEFFLEIGIGIGSIIMGSIFIGLGYFIKRGHNFALGLALAIYVLDTFLTFGAITSTGGHVSISAVLIRIAVIGAMIRGFGSSRS